MELFPHALGSPSASGSRRLLLLAPVMLASLAALVAAPLASAREHITLRNGYDLICDHRQADGETTRLFLDAGAANYLDIQTSQIADAEPMLPLATSAPAPPMAAAPQLQRNAEPAVLTAPELRQVLAAPGTAHDLDLDLLASVVHAESAGRVHAKSRAGAQGLMQLMPGTATQLGVHDAFAAAENVNGGTAYLDTLLHRYHDNLAFALAAYNAGPAAVDRWHGVPPYPETRAYVARIIHEFNQRYAARLRAARQTSHLTALTALTASTTLLTPPSTAAATR